MSIKRGIVIGFGNSGGAFVIQFISNVVLSRLLLPEEIGIFSVAAAVTMVLQALRDFGVSRYLVQEKELTDAKIRTVFGTALIIGWSLAAAIFLARGGIASFYAKPMLTDILALLSINFLILPFGQPAMALMRREREYGRFAFIGLSGSVVTAAVSIISAMLGEGPLSLAYGSITGSVVMMAIALYLRPQHLILLPSLSEWRQVWRFGAMVSSSNVIVQLGMMSPDLIMGRMLGFAPVGLFSRGLGLSRLFEQISSSAFGLVMGPELGALHRSGQKLTELVLKATNVTAVIGWPFLIFLAFKAKAIIWIFYGNNWLGAVPVTQILCLASAILLLNAYAFAVYEGTGAVRLQLRNEIWLQILSIGLAFLGSLHSLLAVVWLRVLYALVVVGVHSSVFRLYAHIDILYLLKNLAGSASIAVLFGVVLAGLIALEPAAGTPLMAAAIVVGEAAIMTIVHLLLLAAHRHFLWGQIRTMIRIGQKSA